MSGDHNMHQKPRSFVDAVDTSQERVDETVKKEHEPVAWRIKDIKQVVLHAEGGSGGTGFIDGVWHQPAQQAPVAWTTSLDFDDDDQEIISAKIKGKLGTNNCDIPLYTAPPKRKPLTDEDFLNWYDNAIWGNEDFKEGCWRAFEAGWQAAHGIKVDA